MVEATEDASGNKRGTGGGEDNQDDSRDTAHAGAGRPEVGSTSGHQ